MEVWRNEKGPFVHRMIIRIKRDAAKGCASLLDQMFVADSKSLLPFCRATAFPFNL
jgi:hypothetical protein